MTQTHDHKRADTSSACARLIPKLGVAALIGLSAAAGQAWAADPGKGAALYSMHCANCHGQNGEPVWPGAPDFRKLGALMKPDFQLIALLKQGRGVMPSYLGILKDRDMHDVLAHLRTMN